ncbi:MAG: hypothetical protein V4550_01660 [Gemmatimonadota bacterium]
MTAAVRGLSLRPVLVVFLLATCFLSLAFGFNLAEPGENERFGAFELESDDLVTYVVRKNEPSPGGFLGFQGEMYLSQFGLQGRVFRAGARVLGRRVLVYGPGGAVLLLSMTLALLLARLYEPLGASGTLVATCLLGASKWLAYFASSVYWVSFSFLLPFVVVWLLYDHRWDARGFRVILLVNTALLFARALCGYEFLPTIAIASAVPILVLDLAHRGFSRLTAARIGMIGGGSVVALAAALTVHLAAATVATGSFQAAKAAVSERALTRSSISDTLPAEPAALTESLKFRRVMDLVRPHCGITCRRAVIVGMFLGHPAVRIPVAGVPVPIGAFLLLGAWLFWLHARRGGLAAAMQPTGLRSALALSLPLALVAALVWPVMALNHVLDHLHLDAIVFYIPFLPLVYLSLGAEVKARVSRHAG